MIRKQEQEQFIVVFHGLILKLANEPDSAGHDSVWDAGIADKSSFAHCGLLVGPIEIVR